MSERKRFTVHDLANVIEQRRNQRSPGSYTAMSIEKGSVHICKKLQEEVLEVALESSAGDMDRITNELADVIYHTLLLAACHGVTLQEIENCLWSRHKTKDWKNLLPRLIRCEIEVANMSSKELFKLSGFPSSLGADVILFSHTLSRLDLGRVGTGRSFSIAAKEVKTSLQREGFKVKLGVPPDSEERFVQRRSDSILLPVLFVANLIVLPVCLNILSAYIKDVLDRFSTGNKLKTCNQTTQIFIGVAASGKREEKWYLFEGRLDEVLRKIEDVLNSCP